VARRRGLRLGLAAALAGLPLLAPASAQAQLSGGVGVTSDYRIRGVSFTGRRPAMTASLAYDHPSGFYAGGSVVAHDPAGAPTRILGHIEYLGFARRLAGGPTVDVGVNNVDMSLYVDREYSIDYTQVYLGLSQNGLSARAYLAPNYPRQGASTVYLDFSGTRRVAEVWRVSAHVGVLDRLRRPVTDGKRDRYDLSLGVIRELPHGEISLSGTKVFHRPRFDREESQPALILAANWFF
jgi:uncharacterized protein (TIGR02001 family)